MKLRDRWLLPEGIGELLPAEAWALETVRRQLLDCYRGWGYELVITPFIEYLDSLLTGTGHDLDLQTFKLTDQLTGRTLGVRADMTPQVARIDAHRLQRQEPVRLCYLGTVLHTRADGFAGSRSPLQVGAELFGNSSVASDVEVLALMLETLRLTGVTDIHLDLGHVGIFRGLAAEAGLDEDREAGLFDALQRKAIPELRELTADLPAEQGARLCHLATLNGGQEVLDEARQALAGAGAATRAALDNLCAIAEAARACLPDTRLHFDLAELRGYTFHTGLVFAAFVPGHGQEIARGGRYDHIGEVFGRARPATGFSADLKTLLALGNRTAPAQTGGIFAPADNDASLRGRVAELRAAGERVVQCLSGQAGDARAMGCSRELRRQDGQWVVVDLKG
jgi:ATP phosphoribosyltransferase regulatory subunit